MTAITQEALAARGIRVRQLEWSPWGDDMHRHHAVTPYGVEYHADDKGWWIFLGNYGESDGMKSAKAAAQSDYAARILAALEVTHD